MEILVALLILACVLLFACLVQTMMEKNSATDETSRLRRCYERMKADADYWMREAMRLKGHTPPPGVTDQPKPSPQPWTHPGRN